jgi:hypothetical protein
LGCLLVLRRSSMHFVTIIAHSSPSSNTRQQYGSVDQYTIDVSINNLLLYGDIPLFVLYSATNTLWNHAYWYQSGFYARSTFLLGVAGGCATVRLQHVPTVRTVARALHFSSWKYSTCHLGHSNTQPHPNLYENTSISKFKPSTPWAAPAAYADLIMEPFPTLSQMDAKYDSWPESGNPHFLTRNQPF